VTVVPAEIPKGQIPAVFSRLSELLGLPRSQFEKKVPPAYYHLYQSIELVSNVSLETISMLAERSDELPGVSWQSKPIRSYVDTGSLSHIIGYVGDITRKAEGPVQQGLRPRDIIGKAGIESSTTRYSAAKWARKSGRGRAGQKNQEDLAITA
jgi:penicillin-binding protein 2